jgi:hypothetical protein
VPTGVILCSNFNINHLDDTPRKHLLESLLASFNLFSTVNFPTGICNNSGTHIDNIYINTEDCNFSIFPLINDISDHEAQIINLTYTFNFISNRFSSFSRKINKESTLKFKKLLSYENWEDVFVDKDVNTLFNNFLNTYLRIFYACFPIRKETNTRIVNRG